MLLKALTAFFILIYIHISYSQTPATCLEHLKTDGWPRDGIIRVEILRPGDERVMMKDGVEDLSDELTMLRNTHKDGLVSIDPSTTLPHEENELKEMLTKSGETLREISLTDPPNDGLTIDVNSTATTTTTVSSLDLSTSESLMSASSTEQRSMKLEKSIEMTETKETYNNESISDATINDQKIEDVLKTDVPEVEKLINAVSPDDQYIVEYSLEYGFLRLSAATRQRLNIPVLVVTLNPQTDKCFGDTFSRFILQEFLGYDDLLMASVKVLAEQEDNKGYLRNVITGEHYRFVSMWWMQRGSYLASLFIMILFVSCTYLLLLLWCRTDYISIFSDNFNFHAVEIFASPNFRVYRYVEWCILCCDRRVRKHKKIAILNATRIAYRIRTHATE